MSKTQGPNDPTSGDDAKIRRWRLDELLGGAREAIIEHEGQEYRLRITSNDKLILTK